MGKISQGILGGFSGKVGTVIGSSWKSIQYMRAIATSVKDAQTEKQLLQRSKFQTSINFLKTATSFVRIGYQNYAYRQSEFNAAMSHMLRFAVTSDGEQGTIDFGKTLLSQGSLTTATDAAVQTEAGKATFTWTDNSDTGNATATDKVMVLAYNKDKQETVYDTAAATRADGTAELVLPASWADDALAIYLAFYSEDGKRVSNSQCLKNDAASTQPGDDGDDDSELPLG